MGLDVFGGDTAITVKRAQFEIDGFGGTAVRSGGWRAISAVVGLLQAALGDLCITCEDRRIIKIVR